MNVGMRKIMKRARKEGMKEENKGSQLIGSSCLMSKIKISERITRKDRRRNTD